MKKKEFKKGEEKSAKKFLVLREFSEKMMKCLD